MNNCLAWIEIFQESAEILKQTYLNRGKKALLMLGVKFVAIEEQSDLPPLLRIQD